MTTETERNTLLSEPDILAQFDKTLDKMGFVGSTDVSRLVFLAMYTRWYKDPVSVLIMGESCTGKNDYIEYALKLVPKDEAYRQSTVITQKALLYFKQTELKHKFVYFGEQASLPKEGMGLLRQLISGKSISGDAPEFREGEGRVTVNRTVEGPMGYLMTTTPKELLIDDDNRGIVIRIKSDPNKVKEVLKRQGRGDGLATEAREEDTKPWFNLHKTVSDGSKAVVIPFADALIKKITDNATADRLMRDNPKVLNLIRAHALLHQNQKNRKRGKAGAVIATLDDYKAVRPLVDSWLVESINNEATSYIREVVEVVEVLVKVNEGAGVKQKQIADAFGKEQGAIHKHIKAALNKGYLVNGNPGQGKDSSIKVGKPLSVNKVLPTVFEVWIEYELCRKSRNPAVARWIKQGRGRYEISVGMDLIAANSGALPLAANQNQIEDSTPSVQVDPTMSLVDRGIPDWVRELRR
jgi:hypothetical protein